MSDARVEAARRAFDESFARPADRARGEFEELLETRSADLCYAVPGADLSWISAAPSIVAVPGGTRGLLGVAGVRGDVVGVFGLAELLGVGRTASPRWLLGVRGRDRLTVAIEEVDGYRRTDRAALQGRPGEQFFFREHADRRAPTLVRVVSFASLLAASQRGQGR